MGKNEQQLEQRKAYSLYGLWEPWSLRDVLEIARLEVVGRCVFFSMCQWLFLVPLKGGIGSI